MTPPPEPLRSLLLRLEDDDLSPEERSELEARMAADPALADAVVAHYLLSSEIATEMGVIHDRARATRIALERQGADPPRAARRRSRWLGAAAALGLIASAAMAAVLVFRTFEARERLKRGTDRADVRRPSGSVRTRPVGELAPAPLSQGADEAGRSGAAEGGTTAPGHARRAPSAAVNELALLRSMPADLLLALTRDQPDEEGFSVSWRVGERCVGAQRSLMRGLFVGAALSRRDLVDSAFRAVDAAFRASDAEWGMPGNPNCAAYFLCDLGHALLVLRESELAVHYDDRVRALRPRLATVAAWLSERVGELRRQQSSSPSGQAYYAGAFGFAGLLLDDDKLKAYGAEVAAMAVASSRRDGAFEMFGRTDSGYQGNVLYRLSWYALRFPEARLDDALARGGRWQLARVDDEGRLDVTGNARTRDCSSAGAQPCFAVNFDEVVWGLLYHAARFQADALPVARRVHETRRAHATKR